LPAADIIAVRLPTPPAIDGLAVEWNFPAQAASQFIVAEAVEMPWQPVAVWWIGWDDQALYVFADVTDPEILQPWSDRPDQLWQGDSVHFEFGPDPTGLDPSTGLRPDDVHVLLGPIEETQPQTALVAVNRVRGAALVPGDDEADVEAMSVLTDAPGYGVEAKIPWDVLGISSPALGATFAMNVNVSDGDGDLRSMVSNNPDRDQPHPGTWTTLVLGQ
jgi:hypothetical protein